MDQGYSTRRAAKLTHLTGPQVRSLARAGAVQASAKAEAGPKRGKSAGAGRLRLSFADLRVLRTAAQLLSAGLSLARVGRALRVLHQQLARRELPPSAGLCRLEGNRVVASDGQLRWDVESGEALAKAPSSPDARLHHLLRGPGTWPRPEGELAHPFAGKVRWPEKTFGPADAEYGLADAWFERGLRAEQAASHRAGSFYLQALACDPEHVEAMINLGRLCAANAERVRAAAFFRAATRIDPGHAVAHFNLAVTLHDEGECGAAMQAYRKALLLDPKFADAHFNLGTLLAQQGHNDEAGTHFSAFRAATRPAPPNR